MPFQFDLSHFPLRSEPSHKSEMVNQILFGEDFDVIDSHNDWHRITLGHDGYEGWLERKDRFTNVNKTSRCLTKPFRLNGHQLTPGCLIAEVDTKILPEDCSKLVGQKLSTEKLLPLAMQYLETPYLWGGRTLFGIDCSGFTQIVARLGGWNVPRDAYQQADLGKVVQLDAAEPLDLAFFSNKEGRITHVGFVLKGRQILHASEKVRIDKLDTTGIYREAIGEYTHYLSHISRMF